MPEEKVEAIRQHLICSLLNADNIDSIYVLVGIAKVNLKKYASVDAVNLVRKEENTDYAEQIIEVVCKN